MRPGESWTLTLLLKKASGLFIADVCNKDRDVHSNAMCGAVAVDEATPGLVALVDDLCRVLLVLGLARERELVLRLAVGDLVDAAVDSL
jgi:hypothetical protein